MAKSLVTGKLWNSKQLLLKLNRRRNSERVASAIVGLDQDLRKVERLEPLAENLDVLRGLEGASAARYFPALGQLITQPDFELTHRSRRPPTDPVNSLLSFGYTLLFNNVLSLIRLEGLNPYLGNLHRSERHEPHLVCDLMEEFRSPIADTLMLALVNQRMLKPDDFTEPNEQGGVYLCDRSRRLFIQAFEKRMSTELAHPDSAKPVTYRRAIQLQIRRYKRCLLEDMPYEPFRRVT